MVTSKFPLLDLQIFAEGTGGDGTGGDASDAATQEGVNAADAALQQNNIQTEKAPETEDRNARYKALIKEFKDLDDARVQSIVKNRVRSSEETVARYSKLSPVLELLSQRYGVDASDVDALAKAVEADDSYFEEEALKRGITVEQLKEFKKMERENTELRRMRDEQERKQNADRIYQNWLKQAESTKQVYSDFDLEAEIMSNPKFVELIKNNIDVRSAYEVTHKDDIIASAMQFAAKEAESKLASSIAANKSRPNENGTSSQGASQVKSDVSKLTRAEREDIARRVARGEKIVLG